MRSQFNDWVSRAEDPEKILNQAVEEMEEGLERARVKIGALRFRIDEQEKLLKRLGEQAEYWRERAEDYVKRNMDENAVEAVRKRRTLEEKERKLAITQSRATGRSSRTMKRAMRTWRGGWRPRRRSGRSFLKRSAS